MLNGKETLHQSLAVTPVNFNELNQGLGYGWISPTLEKLKNANSEIPLSSQECSWIAALQELGRTFIPLLMIFILDKLGRKKILIFTSFIFFIQWIILLFTETVWTIFLVRLLFGLAIGMNDVTSSIYFGENSSPSIRGIFGSLSILFFYIGVLMEYVFANYLSYRVTIGVNAVINFCTLLTGFLLVESPQFLLTKGQIEQAKKNYVWLMGDKDKEVVDKEFAAIRDNIEKELIRKKSIVKLLSTPLTYKIVIIVSIKYTLTMATGFSAINSFATISFVDSDFLSKKEFTIVFGLAQLVAVSLSPFFIERFNRRSIMMTFYGLAAFTHLCSAGLFYVHYNVVEVPYFSFLIFISITSYSSLYAMGILPNFCLLRGELFSQNIKVVGGCISIIGNSLMGIFINHMYLDVAEKYGIHVNFLFFSFSSFVLVLFVYFILPETKGRSLLEIQRQIEKK